MWYLWNLCLYWLINQPSLKWDSPIDSWSFSQWNLPLKFKSILSHFFLILTWQEWHPSIPQNFGWPSHFTPIVLWEYISQGSRMCINPNQGIRRGPEYLAGWWWGSHCMKKSVQEVSIHVIWKIETFTEEDTRYKKHVHRTMMLQFPLKEAPWDLTQFSQSPSAALPYFSESHQWPEISSL